MAMKKKSKKRKSKGLQRVDAILQTMIDDGLIVMDDGSIYGQDLSEIMEIAAAMGYKSA